MGRPAESTSTCGALSSLLLNVTCGLMLLDSCGSLEAQESNSMSPQVTFKSNDDKAPQVDVDSAGRPIPGAPRLCDAVRVPYTPSHGSAPSSMPQPPVG